MAARDIGPGELETGSSFVLGEPALVCRWRIHGGELPMLNRHMRALGARTVNDAPATTELVAWAKQRIEWNLSSGASRYPDGVLMLVVDRSGQAAMTVGPYQPLERTDARFLVARAKDARREAATSGVAPETLWAVRDGALVWGAESGEAPSAAASLIEGLAKTVGLPVRRDPALVSGLLGKRGHVYDEAFLVSDEHGVVPASDRAGMRGDKFARGWERLLERDGR